MKDKSIWNSELQCFWNSWRCIDEKTLYLILGTDSCCDMGGAIRLGKTLLPTVARIDTFNPDYPDVRYEKNSEGAWICYELRGCEFVNVESNVQN